MDNYIEIFVTSETQAQFKEQELRQDYNDVGYYQCAYGYIVWADRNSTLGE